MWAGMMTSEYEYVPGELPSHKPTGIRLERPEWAPTACRRTRGRSGPGQAPAGPPNSRSPRCGPDCSLSLGVTYDVITESTRFRREFGYLDALDRAVPVAPGRPVPWDVGLVEIFATLLFLLHDTEGSRHGKPALPDRIKLEAPELPAELRGTVVINKYGQAWS